MERRNYLIEELIKADPTYRPPADYRPAKKHRKVRLEAISPYSASEASHAVSLSDRGMGCVLVSSHHDPCLLLLCTWVLSS